MKPWENEKKASDTLAGIVILAITAFVFFHAIYKNKGWIRSLRDAATELARANL